MTKTQTNQSVTTPTVISTEYTTGTIAGTRWLHIVRIGYFDIDVVVRQTNGSVTIEAGTNNPDLALAAIQAVMAKGPMN